MREFRITKYDPAKRDERGAYLENDWVCYGEIGQSFLGEVLTKERYELVENAYINAALTLLENAGIKSLKALGIENYRHFPISITDGEDVPITKLPALLRDILRNHYWCKFENQPKTAFVNISFDYYMYVGVPFVETRVIEEIRKSGLFVEDFPFSHYE